MELRWRLEGGITEGTELRSGPSQPQGSRRGRRLEIAKDTSKRTFWRLQTEARVVDEAELGSSATVVPNTDQRSGYVCVCPYMCV